MKAALIVCVLLICAPFVGAQNDEPLTLGEVKQWRFHVQSHEVAVTLRAPNRGYDRSGLSVKAYDGFALSAPEEAELIRKALHEMPSLGYDPNNLGLVSTSLQQSEFRKGVEAALAKSGRWKSCIGRKYCQQVEPVAVQYLHSIDAFKELDPVLHEYGLKRKSIHVDDMGVGMEAGRVLCDGMIFIVLEKEK